MYYSQEYARTGLQGFLAYRIPGMVPAGLQQFSTLGNRFHRLQQEHRYSGRFGVRHRVRDLFDQFFSGFETGVAFGSDHDRFAGARVPSLAGFLFLHHETAEAAKIDALICL